MTAVTPWVRVLCEAATGSLVAAVWQGLLLAAVAAFGLRLLPKIPAAVRFAIWFAVFLLVAGLPVLAVSSGLWAHPGLGAGHRPWLTIDPRWSLAVLTIWAAASLFRAITLLAAAVRVRALWRRATPVTVADLSWQKTSGRRAQVCTSDEIDRPSVIGFFAPRILIPSWLLEKLSPTEIEQIVLHEAGHLGRADDWLNLLQKIALVVFPLNPVLAWIERRLCFERELACDERVLRATNAPRAYAACLAALAEHRMSRRGIALVMAALGRESELGARVMRILGGNERMAPRQARLVMGTAVLALVAGTAALERCPQVIGFGPVAGRHTLSQRTLRNPGVVLPAALRVANSSFKAYNLVARPQAAHEVLLKAIIPAGGSALRPGPRRQSAAARSSWQFTRTLPARDAGQAPADSAARVFRTVARQHPGTRNQRVQWMWMSTWTSANGAGVVMTSFTGSVPVQPVETSPDAATPVLASHAAAPAPQEAYPYAAVPVRGGWIVFQL